MPVLPMRHDPLVVAALRVARIWYTGHHDQVTGTTALAHAVAVANTIGDHVPGASPKLIAAALLHRAARIVPSAEGAAHLSDLVAGCPGRDVAYLVSALCAAGPTSNLTTAAEKYVTLTAILDQATTSGDERAYWAGHPELAALISECRRFHASTAHALPDTLADLLGALTARAQAACEAEVAARAAERSRN